jgi:hypothetical protein
MATSSSETSGSLLITRCYKPEDYIRRSQNLKTDAVLVLCACVNDLHSSQGRYVTTGSDIMRHEMASSPFQVRSREMLY